MNIRGTTPHMSTEEYRRMIAGAGKSKFGNERTIVDGIAFDSQAEAVRYGELQILERAGEICGFGRQPSFIIDDAGSRYRPDFIVCDKERNIWVEDVKGFETAEFKRKAKQWRQAYPWIPLILIKN